MSESVKHDVPMQIESPKAKKLTLTQQLALALAADREREGDTE